MVVSGRTMYLFYWVLHIFISLATTYGVQREKEEKKPFPIPEQQSETLRHGVLSFWNFSV